MTSIHWHGLLQKGTPYMDGSPYATQCPIAPYSTFDYNFNVGDQVGTYWYHSHSGPQYYDGLFGPFIIDDPNGCFYFLFYFFIFFLFLFFFYYIYLFFIYLFFCLFFYFFIFCVLFFIYLFIYLFIIYLFIIIYLF